MDKSNAIFVKSNINLTSNMLKANKTSVFSKISLQSIIFGLMALLFAGSAMAESPKCLEFSAKSGSDHNRFQLEDRPEGITFYKDCVFSLDEIIGKSKLIYFDNESIGLINQYIERGDDAIKEIVINGRSITLIYENGEKNIMNISTDSTWSEFKFETKFKEMRNYLIQRYGYQTRAKVSKIKRETMRYISDMSEDEIREALGMGKKESSTAPVQNKKANSSTSPSKTPAKTTPTKPAVSTPSASKSLTAKQFASNRLGIIDNGSNGKADVLSALNRNGISMKCTTGNQKSNQEYVAENPGITISGEKVTNYTISCDEHKVHYCKASVIKRGWTKAQALAFAKKNVSALKSSGHQFRNIATDIGATYAMESHKDDHTYTVTVYPVYENAKIVGYDVHLTKFRYYGL